MRKLEHALRLGEVVFNDEGQRRFTLRRVEGNKLMLVEQFPLNKEDQWEDETVMVSNMFEFEYEY